jgi:putative restriction endonuclease
MSDRGRDPEVGCTVLANPFFVSKFDWIENPAGWASNIVRGKMYESSNQDGGLIWVKMAAHFLQENSSLVVKERTAETTYITDGPKFGESVLIKPRLGQSTFRVLVTDAYKRRCAMTGENTLVVLEAAHIVPYANEGTHDVSNGILLRSDFHTLFDKGLVSITPDYRMKISPRIRQAWFNGKAYYRLDDQPLAVLPDDSRTQPDRDRLQWHFKNVFQK